MSIITGNDALASDFINESERNATPANDVGRVPKLESTGQLHPSFLKLGKRLNCGETINGATLPVPVYQNKTDNELYACDGNDTGKLKFLGFVISNGTDGNPADFQGAGIVGGFSGLDEGEKYYLSDTVGTIQNSPGTYAVLVGIAISATELLIQKGSRSANGVNTFSSTTTSAITCGFRPTKIRMVGYAVEPSANIYTGSSAGSWVNGIYACSYFSGDDGSPAAVTGVSTSAILNIHARGNQYFTITITSVTDTGFTISCSESTDGTSLNFYWEAEGEL